MQIQYPQGKPTFNSKKGGKKTPVKNRSITFFTMNTTTTFSDLMLYDFIYQYYQYPVYSVDESGSIYFEKDVDLDKS